MLWVRVAVVISCVWSTHGCRSSESVCDHYMHKSYQPKSKGGLGPPSKAVKACAAVCRNKKSVPACTQTARWHDMLGNTEGMVAMRDLACGYGDKSSCGARKWVERRKERAAYNREATKLRGELAKCMREPAPCEQACKSGDVNACVQLADRAHLGFKGHGKKPAVARAYYQRACDLHDTTHFCWSPFIVPAALCVVPDTRPPCDDDLDGYCPPPPKPRRGCGEVSKHPKIADVREHLAVCNGQRACDTITRSSCLQNIDACKRACDEYDDGARCRQIGLMYKEGLGLPADPTLAAKYIERSCALGSRWPCKKLNRDGRYLKPNPLPVAKGGTPEQAERAPK